MLRLRDGSSLTARLRWFPGGKAGAGKKGFELREVCAIIIVEKNPDALNTAARPLWEQDVGSLSLPSRTKAPLKSLISEGLSYSLSIAAQDLNIDNVQ